MIPINRNVYGTYFHTLHENGELYFFLPERQKQITLGGQANGSWCAIFYKQILGKK